MPDKPGDIRIGLWIGDGNTWKAGKPVEVFGKKYWANAYDNSVNKSNPNSPDLTLLLREVVDKSDYHPVQKEYIPF